MRRAAEARTLSDRKHDLRRWLLAGVVAGAWVVVSGMLMAGIFGYREMKAAFDAVGLPIPAGAGSFLLHTAVRLVIGMAVAGLYAILRRGCAATRAMVTAAGFAWLLAVLLPGAVIAGWGLFSWSLTARLSAWGAAELSVAVVIARLIYGR